MARAAGIEMMPTYLFQAKKRKGFFGVKRFDRVENRRLHLHSLAGLVHADHRTPSLDYDLVLRATQYLTKDVDEVRKAFRLACFNVFAHNRDDHAKNFSFLMAADGRWRFAPAYDLTFSQGPGGEHCTTVLGEGKAPGKTQLMSLATKFGISQRDASAMIAEVQSTISGWASYAGMAGLSKKTTSAIANALHGR